jgi:hypothetical protein
VAFTKVLTVYQLEFTPSIILLFPLGEQFLEYFQQVSFFHLHICVLSDE